MRLAAFAVAETPYSLFRFDNIVFSRPAGHDLNPCSLRPTAADVAETTFSPFCFPQGAPLM